MYVGVALSDDLCRLHRRLLGEAIEHAHMTMQQASAEAEISQAQFTRQLQGIEGSLKRLWMLPLTFWQWYGLVLVSHFGLPPLAQRAARAAFAWFAVRRMRRGSFTMLPMTEEQLPVTRPVTLPIGRQKRKAG